MKSILSRFFLLIIALGLITACQASPTPTMPAPMASPANANPTVTIPTAKRVEDLLARMTLEEKIGQVTQVENGSIKPGDVTARFIGSVLNGGDGAPQPNDLANWVKMVNDYQAAALKTRLAIPLIYGVDAVHDFGGLRSATIFPQNIGLGATRDDAIVTSINAGLDMIMVPDKYSAFIDGLSRAVNNNRVPLSRIDDAVRRILTVKFELGLFEHPLANADLANTVGSDAHRQLARAVRKSLVLLKNDGKTLPLSKSTPLIYVAGQGADDLGMQSGGWTLAWQGKPGNEIPGTTILAGIKQVASQTRVEYLRDGKFNGMADVGIVVVGETLYAEGRGDRSDLSLSYFDLALIDEMKTHSKKLVVILLSGRPLTITDVLPKADAFVAAWLPGSEGAGVADVLFGDLDFTGKLPYTWQRFNTQLPIHAQALSTRSCGPLFQFGYGLSTRDVSPQFPICPSQ